MYEKTSNIVCFGKVLWDYFPTGNVVGGAPMNLAYHATQLGLFTQMISRIGSDLLGESLIDFLNKKGFDTELVQTDDTFPTGIVNVAIDAQDGPSYEIVTPVDWDYIQVDTMNQTAVKNADTFVFGSLSARCKTSRKILLELLDLAKLKVLDDNLRSPHFNKALLLQLLNLADIVKMNDEELEIIREWLAISDTEIETAKRLKKHFNCDQLIVTSGAKGAWLFSNEGMFSSTGTTIEVQDTIGSADSFLAAFLSKYLHQTPIEESLQFASLTGAYVASKKGGTPELSEKQIWELAKKVINLKK